MSGAIFCRTLGKSQVSDQVYNNVSIIMLYRDEKLNFPEEVRIHKEVRIILELVIILQI